MITNKKMIVILVLISIFFSECGTNGILATVASIPNAAKSIILTVGGKKIIKVRGINIQSKKFKSSNTKIATENRDGIVRAKKAGKCKIKIIV